jgi:hypothetical protein
MTAVGAEQPKIKPTRHPRAGVQNSIRIMLIMELKDQLYQIVNAYLYQFRRPV